MNPMLLRVLDYKIKNGEKLENGEWEKLENGLGGIDQEMRDPASCMGLALPTAEYA